MGKPLGFDPDILAQNDVIGIGKTVGLDSTLSLTKACADFYVLEALVRDTHSWDGHNVDPRFFTGGLPPPIDWFSDSRAERQAIEIGLAFSKLESKLAEEFSLYMLLACGGELRYLAGQLTSKTVCTHYSHSSKCCAFNYTHAPDAGKKKWVKDNYGADNNLAQCKPDGGCGHSKADCGCCPHNHVKTCPEGMNGCEVSYTDCCAHHHPKSEKKKPKGNFSPAVMEYLKVSGALAKDGGIYRAAGWGHWYNLTRDDPAGWMYACRDAFFDPIWGERTSVGGKSWGLIASLAADYYSGEITKRTLIDRAWSMQHNGGSVFNKFYETEGLMRVLETQHVGTYESLSKSCSSYVKDLYTRHRIRVGELTLVEHLSKKIKAPKIFSDAPYDGHFMTWLSTIIESITSGCLSCIMQTWVLMQTGYKLSGEATYGGVTGKEIFDPCISGKIWYIPNSDCAYTSNLSKLSPQYTGPLMYGHPDLNEEEPNLGCVACVGSDGDYCFNEDETRFFNPDCGYADEYMTSMADHLVGKVQLMTGEGEEPEYDPNDYY